MHDLHSGISRYFFPRPSPTRRLCVKKWMNGNFSAQKYFRVFIEWRTKSISTHAPPIYCSRYWCWAIFPRIPNVMRAVDLIRWKNFVSKTVSREKVIFHFSRFFLLVLRPPETEHLTNCDRIQWQLTQFVNQFPLHALNIRSWCGWEKCSTRTRTPRQIKVSNCCAGRSHQYFINLASLHGAKVS